MNLKNESTEEKKTEIEKNKRAAISGSFFSRDRKL